MKIFQSVYSSKVWAHRANSIEKFQEARDIYSGVELDLVFDADNNLFDVNHPPAKSTNLSLVEYLKSNKDDEEFGLWLDFKNLNETNLQQSANRLDSIINVLKIDPQQIIVESTKPKLLEEFAKKGFRTSYYLPSNISKLKNEDLAIQHNLISSNSISYLSSDVKNYAFIKDNFPNSKIITWIISNPSKIKDLYTLKRSMLHFKRNFTVLNDKNVEVVLFKFEAKLGNR